NYRSKEGVMRAVNALFHEPAGRQSDGKVSPVFFYEGIRYEAIDSCENRSDKSQVQQHKGIYRLGRKDAGPSLVFIGSQEAYTAFNNLLSVYAEDSAERIVSLLQGKQAATIEKVESGKQHEPVALKPGDIAVLVKNYREADAIKLALRRRNLQAVYLAQKDSVFKRCLF